MAELELEGTTLGQKHQRYNRLVQDAIASRRTVKTEDFNEENNDSDIMNLLKIDIACHNKNKDYILKVLTCEDMLYVSRAIKQSDWLINDKSYANIIHPNYLSKNIFPNMCSKAKCKLMKHIRNLLNDEKRAEEFYSLEENPKEAVKWLPSCSLKFIEENIINHVQHIKMTLLRRLCEKSIMVLEIYIKNNNTGHNGKALQANMFLLTSNTAKYLDLVEAVPSYHYPNFNKRATRILMENSSDRIINKFELYYNSIHLPTFVKCLKQENIKDFLINQAQKMGGKIQRYFNWGRLLLFIKVMPQEIRFEFVKQVFIDKKHESNENCLFSEQETRGMSKLCEIVSTIPYSGDHIWYQFAPFDVAFEKTKEIIGTTSNIRHKISMLEVLLTSAQQNMTQQRTFLEYFRNMHINAEFQIKEEIIKKVLTQNSFFNYDSETWTILDDIFKSMDVYTESENKQYITEAIILYKVLHDEKVPEIVEKKFNFNSLVPYHKKLTEAQKTKIFHYLYSIISGKILKCNTQSEKEFTGKIKYLEQALNLLKDFKQDLDKYPALICITKDLIKIKNDSSWNVNMGMLFNIKKTWRKLFFEESLVLFPTELTLLNVLKHGPYLLEHNKTVVQNMLSNDKLSLNRFLGKIKIYWSNLAETITVTYTEKLNFVGDHKATARGLSILLPKQNLKELLEKYAPKEAKIDWSKIDEIELSVQQQFAKNMHNARPQPHPEAILWYAKGDYLRYALPSLLSIFYNLDSMSSRKYIPALLDAPVSVQKHGIRLAVSKMEIGELLYQFSNIWKNNSNSSIRSVMFKNVYDLLCKEKDSKKIQTTWELMEMFIDNLTFQEDKAIYKLLFQVQKVSPYISGCFYMKSYNFLHKLLTTESDYEELKDQFDSTFTEYSIELLEQLQPDFVAGIIYEFIKTVFTKKKVPWSRRGSIKLISAYLLVANNEESQLERFQKVLLPSIKQLYTLANVIDDNEYYFRDNLKTLLNYLGSDVKVYVVDKKKIIPRTMFSLIQKELEESMKNPENYMLLTKWKLTSTFVDILYNHKPIQSWEKTCTEIAIEFGTKCTNFLREDCDKYYPSLYLLFGKALKSMLADFVPQIAYWDIYNCFIQEKDFIPGHLVAIGYLKSACAPNDDDDTLKIKSKELRKKIHEHPSIEIQIHYYNKIRLDGKHVIE